MHIHLPEAFNSFELEASLKPTAALKAKIDAHSAMVKRASATHSLHLLMHAFSSVSKNKLELAKKVKAAQERFKVLSGVEYDAEMLPVAIASSVTKARTFKFKMS